ncbi:hypothetical protein GFC29_978 [Anoxybacillus sp. B7M1]|jgi:hypothetical protein|nr:hypothetical protein GFC29_978 [Anoxybacillus sp. B7M1]KXG09353.1 hypothetical protein AT864_02307 [Anoxybacillus sp. P3H1B]
MIYRIRAEKMDISKGKSKDLPLNTKSIKTLCPYEVQRDCTLYSH